MRSLKTVVAVFACLGLFVLSVHAQELERVEAKVAHKMAKQLCAQAKRLKNQQLHIDPDVTRAEAVHRDRDAALIVVPQQGLKENRNDNAEVVKTDPGAALGYLFAYHLVPVIRDQPVPAKQLRRVTATDDQGTQVELNCMLLAVRQLEGDDWRLYVYGAEKRPLLEVPFTESSGSETAPLSVACKNVQGVDGDLVLTVFGRYQAQFKVRYQPQ
jgi:hypothetical protein